MALVLPSKLASSNASGASQASYSSNEEAWPWCMATHGEHPSSVVPISYVMGG